MHTNKSACLLLECNWSISNSCSCLHISILYFFFHEGDNYFFSKTFIFLFSNALNLEFQTSKQKNYSCKCFFCVGWVLWEEWENNFPVITHGVFLSKSGSKNQKSMEWVKHKLHWNGISYTMPVKTGLDFSGYKFFKSAAWQAQGALAVQHWVSWGAGKADPQHMGHQPMGDTVPAVWAFCIRMWCQNFPFYTGLFRVTNWTLALTKAPETWAEGQIPHRNKELMPAGARPALSLWLEFPLFVPLPSVRFLLSPDRSIVPFFCPLG